MWLILHHLSFSVHSNGPNNSTFSFPHLISSLPFHSNWPTFTLHLLLSCFSVPDGLTHARPRRNVWRKQGWWKTSQNMCGELPLVHMLFLWNQIMQVNSMSYEFAVIKLGEAPFNKMVCTNGLTDVSTSNPLKCSW